MQTKPESWNRCLALAKRETIRAFRHQGWSKGHPPSRPPHPNRPAAGAQIAEPQPRAAKSGHKTRLIWDTMGQFGMQWENLGGGLTQLRGLALHGSTDDRPSVLARLQRRPSALRDSVGNEKRGE